MNSKMHGWRKVAAYMTDREKKLMAESFFGNAYEGEISRRSSAGEPIQIRIRYIWIDAASSL